MTRVRGAKVLQMLGWWQDEARQWRPPTSKAGATWERLPYRQALVEAHRIAARAAQEIRDHLQSEARP